MMTTVFREKKKAEYETYLRRMVNRFNKELLEETHKVCLFFFAGLFIVGWCFLYMFVISCCFCHTGSPALFIGQRTVSEQTLL